MIPVRGGGFMIVFHEPLKMLAAAGWNGARLQRERQISNGTIAQLRNGKPVTTETINTICKLCNCQPGDIIHYVPDEE